MNEVQILVSLLNDVDRFYEFTRNGQSAIVITPERETLLNMALGVHFIEKKMPDSGNDYDGIGPLTELGRAFLKMDEGIRESEFQRLKSF